MRVLATALLALLATGANPAPGDLAVTLAAHPLAHSCVIASTATIVAFDANATRIITYRFLHSDGTVSPARRLALAGDAAVAQSVADTWTPRGTAPWVALDILAPNHVRSQRISVARCSRRVVYKI